MKKVDDRKIGFQADLLDGLKDSLLNLDPVAWAEKNLSLDGKPFRVHGNGYKPLADIYRTIALSAWKKDAKKIVVKKGRQVGLSVACGVLELYLGNCGLFGKSGKPGIRVMHLFPTLDMSIRFTRSKINSFIADSRVVDHPTKPGSKLSYLQSRLDPNSQSNDNLQFKQFVGGNTINWESMGVTGDRIRGYTGDVMFFDEVQLINDRAISNVTKSLTVAQYGAVGDGVQVYFGTPLRSGSGFWRMWNRSNQQYFQLGCKECGGFFPLYAPDVNWEDVWIDDDLPRSHPSHGFIVKCIHCAALQDKREAAERGKWKAYLSNENEYIGFHINQLFIPTFSRSKIISEKPENSVQNTDRTWANEVLGEFYSGSSAPITSEQLEEACADHGRRFATSLMPVDGRKIYLGCDWGQKVESESSGEDANKNQGQSYSCAVVLTTEGPNLLSIEYATRLKKNDFEHKKDIVRQLFRQYSIDLACGDIGYANDLTECLQKEYGDKFLATQASSRVNGYAKFKDDYFPHTVVFEKDYHYAEVFDMLKKGQIRFPFGSWEQIAFLVSDCTSMDIKVFTDRSGETSMRYVKNGINDGFAALVNAVLAWKADMSNMFNVKNPNNFTSPTQKKSIPAILAHMPLFNRR